MLLDLCLRYLQSKVELQKVKIHENNYGNVSESPGCGTCCGIFNVPILRFPMEGVPKRLLVVRSGPPIKKNFSLSFFQSLFSNVR